MFGEVGLKNTFLFPEPEWDLVPELMISGQKIGLLVTFCITEVRRQDKADIVYAANMMKSSM